MAKIDFPLVKVTNPSNVTYNGWTDANRAYPAPVMEWKHVGDVTVQGTKWTGDTPITASGDPTTNKPAQLTINTGANHDANVLWLGAGSNCTERQVRGIYFRTYTNEAKFRPRITGVALRYMASNGAIYYHGLNYRSTDYTHSKGGSLNYEGGDSSHYYWGVAATGQSDASSFHHDKVLQGVLFHMETTWKSGGAENCTCYIWNLRFICDARQNSAPFYNETYRMWGVKVL